MSPSWEFLLDTLCRWHLCQEFRAGQFFLLCLLFPHGIGEESQEGPDTPRGEPPPQGAGHQREGAFASLETNSAPGSSAVQSPLKLCQLAHSCWFLYCSLSVTSQVPSKGPVPRTGEEASAVPPGGICGPDVFSFPTARLSKLHQDPSATQQQPPAHLWHGSLQPPVCLHCEFPPLPWGLAAAAWAQSFFAGRGGGVPSSSPDS